MVTTMTMNENKYKTIYSDVIPVYREDEDYCRMALDMLEHAIDELDKSAIEDAFGKLAKCFDGLTKTVGEISIRFREASELLDDYLENNCKPEIDEERHSVYCVGGGLFLDPLEVRHWISEMLPYERTDRIWYHVPYNMKLRRGVFVCRLGDAHNPMYRVGLLRCYPMLDLDDGVYSSNGVTKLLGSHSMGDGANMISRRLIAEHKEVKENER